MRDTLQSRPFRDLSTCLEFETTEAIECNDLNIWKLINYYFVDT